METKITKENFEIGQVIIAHRNNCDSSVKIVGHNIGPYLVIGIKEDYLVCAPLSSTPRNDKIIINYVETLDDEIVEYINGKMVSKIKYEDVISIKDSKLSKDSLFKVVKNYVNRCISDRNRFNYKGLLEFSEFNMESLRYQLGDVVYYWEDGLENDDFFNSTYVIVDINEDKYTLLNIPDYDKINNTSQTKHVILKNIDSNSNIIFLNTLNEKDTEKFVKLYNKVTSTKYDDKSNYKVGTILEDVNEKLYYINGVNSNKYNITIVKKTESTKNTLCINNSFYKFNFNQRTDVNNISYLRHFHTLTNKEFENVKKLKVVFKSINRNLIIEKNKKENRKGRGIKFHRVFNEGDCLVLKGSCNQKGILVKMFDTYFILLDYGKYVKNGITEFYRYNYSDINSYTLDDSNDDIASRYDIHEIQKVYEEKCLAEERSAARLQRRRKKHS